MTMTSQQLEQMFEEKAKLPSDFEAQRHLSAGHWISYRERDTPKGYVLRKYPDGRVEMVKVDLAAKLMKR